MGNTTEKPKNFHEGHRQRLREKFDKDPVMSTFQDHEMLEFLLSLVIPRKDTNVLAHELLEKIGPLDTILQSQPNELFQIKNMTTSASYLLAMMAPFIRRALMQEVTKQQDLSSPSAAIEYLHKYFIGRNHECFALLLLDINMKLKKEFYYEGKTDNVTVNSSDIILKASKEYAKYVIIAHNHPSGNLTPSVEDIDMTKRLLISLKLIDIELVDHIIYSNDGFFSMHNNGLIANIKEQSKAEYKADVYDRSIISKSFYTNIKEYVIDPIALNNENEIIVTNKQDVIKKSRSLYDFMKETDNEENK